MEKVTQDAPERKLATDAEVQLAMDREVVRAVLLGYWLTRGGR